MRWAGPLSSFLAAILVAFAAERQLLPAAEPVNLIANGGFEDGAAGWQPDAKHELLTQPGVAHSGRACLSGEVTSDRQALTLRRSVAVRTACRYQFEIWAKATQRTKLVLRIAPPGTVATAKSETRPLVGAWEELPNVWKKYTCEVPVKTAGSLELQIIAPSSHGAPPGRIWIDDIALYESEQAQVTSASAGEGYNDEAAMARADDGSLYLAWNSFRDSADSLQIARYQPEGKQLKQVGRWQALGGPGTYLLGVKAVAAGNEIYFLYAAEVKGNWDIYALRCSAAGPGRPIRISSSPDADVKPAGAWHNGTLWVAWESNLGARRQIFSAWLRQETVSTPAQVSTVAASNYNPTIAVLANGEVNIAWHSFRENNFDVYLRRRSGAGTWEAERRLTQAPTIDRHPLLLSRGDDLWLVYENALMGSPRGFEEGSDNGGYRIGGTTMRRLIVAKVTAEGLLMPKGYLETSPVYRAHSEAPAAVFDGAGRLWLACRTLAAPAGSGRKAKSRAWQVSTTCFDGGRWTKLAEVSSQTGMDRYPCLALAGDCAVIAFQGDDTPGNWPTVEQSKTGHSEIYLASLRLDPPAGQPAPPVLETLAEPKDAFPPGVIRVARGEDRPTASISYRGERLNLYYGDLHDHTEISICNRTGDESVDESYANMRDITRLDFACATDHGYNINPYLWCYLAKLARINDDRNRFLTFLAEEWTSSFEEYDTKHPYGFYGHRNLIFADPYLPRWWNERNRQTPAEVWEDLRKLKANFVQIPHQLADTGNVPTDWDYTDERAQPVAEIFQGRGSYEHRDTPRQAKNTTPTGAYFLQDAWARGIVIGVIASPDHTGGYGKACVYAPELTREAILDALRARRCFGTTAAKMMLDVRVNDHLMGEKIAAPAAGPVGVKIVAHCPTAIERVEVCRNNQFIYTTRPTGADAELTFVDRDPLPGRSYYYVRLIQKDEEIAWSSPVWFGAP